MVVVINQTQVAIKLKALQEKDLALIVKQKVYLPNLGVPKDEKAVTDWLKPKIDMLLEIQHSNVAQVAAKIDALKIGCASATLTLMNSYSKNVGITSLPVAKDYDAYISFAICQYSLESS